MWDGCLGRGGWDTQTEGEKKGEVQRTRSRIIEDGHGSRGGVEAEGG